MGVFDDRSEHPMKVKSEAVPRDLELMKVLELPTDGTFGFADPPTADSIAVPRAVIGHKRCVSQLSKCGGLKYVVKRRRVLGCNSSQCRNQNSCVDSSGHGDEL